MLTVVKILAQAAVATAEYFAQLQATGDYYVNDDGDPYVEPGGWIGKLARTLGQAGELGLDELLRVLDGRHPETGAQLTRTWKKWTRDRIAGHDLCFSAPSSVSALWATAAAPTRAIVQAAHDEAVGYAFAHIERHAKVVRRRDTTRTDPTTGISPIITETAAGLIGATYRHHTSRQTKPQATFGFAVPPDPQLHTHTLVFMAQRHDGAIVAVDGPALYKGMREGGAIYRARLAANLQRQGFGIERRTGNNERYFEVTGVPEPLREDWSSRRREITTSIEEWRSEFLAEYGRSPTHLEARAWAVTQRVKKGIWLRGQLDDKWRDTAAWHGFTPAHAEALRGGGRSPVDDPVAAQEQLMRELLGEDGLTQRDSAFSLRMLRVRAYEWSAGLLDAPEVEQAIAAVQRHGEVVQLNEELWTTREMLDLEREVIRWKRDRRRPARHPTPRARQLGHALIHAPVPLSPEQQRALIAVLGEQTACVTGQAGTGKGVVLGVAADVWHQQGRRVFALALGGRQAQQLGADLGRHAIPLTIDSFTLRVQHGRIKLRDSDVIAIDEAGQVGTRQWVRLAQAIGDVPQVVAVGDAAQLAPLAAGGVWPMLAAGGPQLTEVYRTRSEWERAAQLHIRVGEGGEGMRLYARHGHLQLLENRVAAQAAAVDAWDTDRRIGLIISDASNREVFRINRVAQARKQAAGELGETKVDLETQYGTISLHAGDRVQFHGQWRPAKQARVENRTAADVLSVDAERGVVVLRTHEATSRMLEVDLNEYRGLELHYAMHVQTGQGATVDRTYVIAGGWQTHRQSMYVACSRARYATYIFLDHESLGRSDRTEALEEAATRASESREKWAAMALRAQSRRVPQRALEERYRLRQCRREADAEGRAHRDALQRLRDSAKARYAHTRATGIPSGRPSTPTPPPHSLGGLHG